MKCRDIGPPDAKIALVGEAPGEEEERQGIPFVGSAGHCLKGLLSASGINYKECYTTNVMLSRPRANNFSIYYEDSKRNVPKKELLEAWKNLKDRLNRVKPNIIIALGNEALRALTNKKGIGTWRGSILDSPCGKVIGTYHPAGILRQYAWKPMAEIDLTKAYKESFSPELNLPKYNFIIEPNLDDVLSYISSIDKYCSFDIESSPPDQQIRCLGLSKDNRSAICIPFTKTIGTMVGPKAKTKTLVQLSTLRAPETTSEEHCSYWRLEEEIKILDALDKLFRDESIMKIGQNAIAFDIPELERQLGLKVKGFRYDTMYMFHACYMELPKSLDFQSSVFTRQPNYWTGVDKSQDKELWTYNCFDCAVTFECFEKLEIELKSLNVESIYYQHMLPLGFALSRAQNIGVKVDLSKREELAINYKKLIADKQKDLDKIVGHELNVNSFPQMSKYLYDEMRFPQIYNRNGGITCDENAIKRLHRKFPNQEGLQLILNIRGYKTILSTFLQSKLDEDGIVRTSYNVCGTQTGRISSSKTIRGTGANLQNIPKHTEAGKIVRSFYISRDLKAFIRGDFSQAEARVVGRLLKVLGKPILDDLFSKKQTGNSEAKFDIHTWHAAKNIFKCSSQAIDPIKRFIAKTCIHAGNYKGGPNVLIKQAMHIDSSIIISYSEAKQALQRHVSAFSLNTWWQDVERKLKSSRTLTTVFGRKRIFFGRLNNDETLRTAIAFEPQGTIGDLNNRAFYMLDQYLDHDCYPLLQVHDEVVVECPLSKVEKVIEQIKELVHYPLKIGESPPLEIPFEIEIGLNWKDTMPLEVFKDKGFLNETKTV